MSDQAPTVDLTANHNAEIISVTVVFSALSFLSVVARLVSRKMQSISLATDEYLLIASWVIATAECAMFAAATHFAKGGWHTEVLVPDDLVRIQKVFYSSSFLQTSSLALAKLSLLRLLHRIFVTRAFRITVYVLAAIVVSWWAAIFFGGAFICYPAAHIWDPTQKGTCGNQEVMDLISPIPWVLTDFAILISPIPVIKNLQLDGGRRLRVYIAFMMGGITCVVSVLRYRTIFIPIKDVAWDLVPSTDWNMIEVHVTIICAALVASKPVLVRILPRRLFSTIHTQWDSLRRLRSTREDNSGSFEHIDQNSALRTTTGPDHKNGTEGATELGNIVHDGGRPRLSTPSRSRSGELRRVDDWV